MTGKGVTPASVNIVVMSSSVALKERLPRYSFFTVMLLLAADYTYLLKLFTKNELAMLFERLSLVAPERKGSSACHP